MADPMPVSVVIPAFDAERTVAECVRSALRQSAPPSEVIVVDDGSTDGTAAAAEDAGAVVLRQANAGACAARNRGLRAAGGEWVQFIDADDVLHPDKLARQFAHSATLGEGEVSACDGRIEEQGGEAWTFAAPPPGDPIVALLRGGLPTPAPLHRRRTLLDAGGWREDLPCSQERELHLRLACRGVRFVRTPETLYTVRKQPASISADPLKVLRQHLVYVPDCLREAEARGLLGEESRRAAAALLASDARRLLRGGDRATGAAMFAEATRWHPDGGLREAYGRATRILRGIVGPALTERIAAARR